MQREGSSTGFSAATVYNRLHMAANIAGEIQVVLFDVGGVLVELSGVATMLAWMNNSVSVEELWRLWLSSPAVRQYETGLVTADEFAGRIVREMRLPVSEEEFLAAFIAWPRGLLPGALDVVRSVPAQFKRATLCNTCSLHWPRVMKELDLEHAFDHHFASHLTGKIKPDKEAFEHVAATLRCKPSAIFFLDDNTLNVEAARKVGMHAAQVKGPAEARAALITAGVVVAGPALPS
jgi:HAD superfamily hydrolase (TIGR01509 family)